MNIYVLFALTMTIIAAIVAIPALYRLRKSTAGGGTTIIKDDKEMPGRFFGFVSTLLDKYWFVILFLTFVVYLVTRLYKLDYLPMGIHVDELSVALDSKCIRDWGTDRFGVHHPAYFINNGGGQNALYTYVMSIIIRFLPCTVKTLRLFAVFCGAICLFAMFGICYEITESKKWALIGPILVTILPIFIMSERWALESYLLLPFSTYFMYFAIRAIKYEKIRDFIITGILMGLTLYTYAVSFIVLPVMLVLTAAYLVYFVLIRLF